MDDAQRYFAAGGSHARATHALVAAARAEPHMRIPFYLLMGNSIETVLKAALVHLGGDRRLARKLGHDLPAVLAAARDVGFEPRHEHGAWLVDAMADTHRRHMFRYLEGDDILGIPDEAIGLDALDDPVAQVGEMLHPDRTTEQWVELLRRYEPPPI